MTKHVFRNVKKTIKLYGVFEHDHILILTIIINIYTRFGGSTVLAVLAKIDRIMGAVSLFAPPMTTLGSIFLTFMFQYDTFILS